MRYIIITFLVGVAMFGCYNFGKYSQHLDNEKIVAQVGPYRITQGEYLKAKRASLHADSEDLASNRVFLENMINRKLILLDAEGKGLDKRQDFLDMIQNFWEQSLLTVALQKKAAEFASSGHLPGEAEQQAQEFDHWIDNLRQVHKVQIFEENLQAHSS
jgi:hypothetical protein